MRKHIKGIDASPGVAIGKVFLYKEVEVVLSEDVIELGPDHLDQDKQLVEGLKNITKRIQ